MGNQKNKGLTCKEAGCDRAAASLGKCRLHYQRDYQRGVRGEPDYQPRPRFNRSLPCAVEGCERRGQVEGLCLLHYERKRKHGSPLVIGKKGPSVAPERITIEETSPTRLARILGVSRQRAHQLLHREAHNARNAVGRAVRAGEIAKPAKCERCSKKTADLEAHHWDYREALDVRWLCPPCHAIVHPHYPGTRKDRQETTSTSFH